MATYTGIVTTKEDPLRIRSGPSTGYAIVGSLPIGVSVVIYEIAPKSNGSKWGLIHYNKKDAWICIKEAGVSYYYVKIDKPNNTAPTKETDANKKEEPKKDTAASLIDSAKDAYAGGTVKDPKTEKRDSAVLSFGGQSGVTPDTKKVPDILQQQIRTNALNKDINHYDEARFVQNAVAFPPEVSVDAATKLHKYNYYMDYDATDFKKKHQEAKALLNLNIPTPYVSFTRNVNYYNRYKLANPNEALPKTFAHVFFVRPNLNILRMSGNNFTLPTAYADKPWLYYPYKHSIDMMRELVIHNGQSHQFMMMLSNKAESFEISDEYIKTDTYGDGYTGYKIPYGKHNVESKTASTFKVAYTDDHDLHIYQLHKLWTEYIAAVYRGEMSPREYYLKNKIIDYATAVYYILCGEDGETVLFWSKYYGVFPTMSPSSVLSWGKGNLLANPEYSIEYQYAFKEDFNPLSLVEFNGLSGDDKNYTYAPSYSGQTLSVGKIWTGAPFIETIVNSETGSERPYTLKLRFRPK